MENQKVSNLNHSSNLIHDSKKNENLDFNVERMSHDIGNKLGTMASDVAHSANEYVKTGREFVVENPVKGIAIAAVSGAVVGSLITLAVRKRH